MAVVKLIRDEDGDLWVSDGDDEFHIVSSEEADTEIYIKNTYGCKAETEVVI